jgi:hypothetical protein
VFNDVIAPHVMHRIVAFTGGDHIFIGGADYSLNRACKSISVSIETRANETVTA